MFSVKSEEAGSDGYNLKSDKVYNFLSLFFTHRDTEGVGYFTVDEFWTVMKALPLWELGLTVEDIDSMKELCTEWESDGECTAVGWLVGW